MNKNVRSSLATILLGLLIIAGSSFAADHHGIFDFNRDLDRIFHNFRSSIDEGFYHFSGVEIVQQEKQMIVNVDIPGIDPKNIDLRCDDHHLTIKGERIFEAAKHTKEERKQTFYQRIVLPSPVNSEKISATSKNGVLYITVPITKDNNHGKKIDIKA